MDHYGIIFELIKLRNMSIGTQTDISDRVTVRLIFLLHLQQGHHKYVNVNGSFLIYKRSTSICNNYILFDEKTQGNQ